MSTQVPVMPLLYGAAWGEVSSTELHRLADQWQPVHEPGPQHARTSEYTILHLTPASVTAAEAD